MFPSHFKESDFWEEIDVDIPKQVDNSKGVIFLKAAERRVNILSVFFQFSPLSFSFLCFLSLLALLSGDPQNTLAIIAGFQAICTYLFKEKTRGKGNITMLSSANHSELSNTAFNHT